MFISGWHIYDSCDYGKGIGKRCFDAELMYFEIDPPKAIMSIIGSSHSIPNYSTILYFKPVKSIFFISSSDRNID